MTAETRTAAAEAEIRTLIDDWAEAMRAKDANRVRSLYAADAVTFDLAPPLISTRSDAEGLEAWFSTWRASLGYEIRGLQVTASEDVAFCHSLDRLSGTALDGAKSVIWFRRTAGLRRVGGAWKIAHEHESVPFYMDGSDRAAVDLEP